MNNNLIDDQLHSENELYYKENTTKLYKSIGNLSIAIGLVVLVYALLLAIVTIASLGAIKNNPALFISLLIGELMILPIAINFLNSGTSAIEFYKRKRAHDLLYFFKRSQRVFSLYIFILSGIILIFIVAFTLAHFLQNTNLNFK